MKGSSAHVRILALIARGEFAEAQLLISEASAAGLISKELATRHLHRISVLTTRLGDIPATLQRAPDFPSQLKDYTLFQIRRMLETRDFSLATSAQLRMAVKLIEDQKRLMEK
ncbi:hypothetical protein [Myxococcus sp. RHSTA-1-4]|uniref:hypothetical protein n=1 Tax=Myxococcus sp. RHSTA-1-4 TaxID=2874601 RepID=UPI001CBCFF2B|nr:hypothetical protein [Myxococcus sp. RHSTA-1-4]MBZ4418586.1 hypothetical protein [Myxococcus sp. RHSTA-1-4]